MNTKPLEKMLSTMSILYVESDERFKLNVAEALNMKAKNVFVASTIQETSTLYNENHIDIIITDVNVTNDQDGVKFIEQVRRINKEIPIIVISASTNLIPVVKLIKFNLVDYIFKPISLKQLQEALYESVTRIINSGTYVIYFKNNISYNIQKNELIKDGKEISLTNQERVLLNSLILNQNMILSMETIKDIVWEDGYYASDAAFKSLINRLRGKIGKESIKNSSGNGYILNV
jgi:DNA-binding response OmpR family regulator